MLHLSRAISALLILVALSIGGIYSGSPSASADFVPAPLQHARIDAARDAKDEAPKDRPVMVTIEAKKFRLTYPLAYTPDLPPAVLVGYVEAAFARVERLLGPFDARIEMFVPGRIVPDDPDFPENLSIAGVCFVDDSGQIHVVVSKWAAGFETFAHELFHARLRDLGVDPPGWFEEGMAHFVEHKDGFNPDLYDLLKEKGPLRMEEIKRIKGVTKEEMRLRATAWALVYYLVEIQGHEFKKVMQLGVDELPDPEKAFAAIKALREKKPEAPKLKAPCSMKAAA
jgi:hypothetical protein